MHNPLGVSTVHREDGHCGFLFPCGAPWASCTTRLILESALRVQQAESSWVSTEALGLLTGFGRRYAALPGISQSCQSSYVFRTCIISQGYCQYLAFDLAKLKLKWKTVHFAGFGVIESSTVLCYRTYSVCQHIEHVYLSCALSQVCVLF